MDYWKELFDDLNNMSDEEFAKLLDELEDLPLPFEVADMNDS